MQYKNMEIQAFVDVLASAEPTPGGGGAAALVAAIGTALGNMVGSLTLGKKKYAEVQDEIIALKKECDALQERFLHYIDADAQAFAPLASAYGLPKDTAEQAEYKAKVMEDALEMAVSAPVKLLDTVCEALDIMVRFGEIGSRIAISDVACAAVSLKSAMQSAAVNIYINTRLMKRRDFAEKINRETITKVSTYSALADRVYSEIASQLQNT